MSTELSDRRKQVARAATALGKLPPQAIDLEEVVLGSILIERDAIYTVLDILEPRTFYRDSHQLIYEAIISLHRRGDPVDIMTVTVELRRMGKVEMVGGAYYITELTSRVSSAANIEYHARVLMQHFVSRELIRECSEVISDAYDDTHDPFDLLNRVSKFLDDIQGGSIGSSEVTMEQLTTEAAKRRDDPATSDIVGLSTGSALLDKAINGAQEGNVIVIAARPGMGKTAVLCSIAKSMGIDQDMPVVIFSLEMSARELHVRLQSNVAEVNGRHIKGNKFSDEEMQRLQASDTILLRSKIIIDDSPFMTAAKFKNKLAVYKRRYGIRAAFLDYIQLMSPDNPKLPREQQVAEISRACKIAAKTLGIPVFVLAQLSRDVEKRPGKIPQLSDLRESGAIEQDADVVMFLHRPEYYHVKEPTRFSHFNFTTIENKGLLVGVIAKQRDGDTYSFPWLFKPGLMQITDHPDVMPQSGPDFSSERDRYDETINQKNKDHDDLPF